MALTHFGEQFAAKTLRKFYQNAITPAITNSNYEGELKKYGDRVAILSFLNDITLTDYTANSDMSVEYPVDSEDQLVVEKRKYSSFAVDKLDELFSRYNNLKTEVKDLKNGNEVLKAILKDREEKMKELETKYERVKLSGALLGEGENALEAKKKIGELVREIDRCVALLNR